MKITLLLIALALEGCAALPNTIAPEFEHMSHATQHEPMTNAPTEYGAEILNLTAEWNLTPRFYIALSEGIALNNRDSCDCGYGEIGGPREQFTGRMGYRFTVRK